MPHFNIQLSIQKVEHTVSSRTVGMIQSKTDHERHVTKVAEIAITADTEQDAFSKTYRLLEALKPEPAVVPAQG